MQFDGLDGRTPELPGALGPEDGSDGPVFVDESGRRGRNLRRVGWLFGIAFACYGAVLAATMMGGNSTAPWLLIPGQPDSKNAETVKISPAPTGSLAPPRNGDDTGRKSGKPLPDSTGSVVPVPAADTGSSDAPASRDRLVPRVTSQKPKPAGDAVVPPPAPGDSATPPAAGSTTGTEPGRRTDPKPKPSTPGRSSNAPEPSADPVQPSGEDA